MLIYSLNCQEILITFINFEIEYHLHSIFEQKIHEQYVSKKCGAMMITYCPGLYVRYGFIIDTSQELTLEAAMLIILLSTKFSNIPNNFSDHRKTHFTLPDRTY
jgi:hypothetical protein